VGSVEVSEAVQKIEALIYRYAERMDAGDFGGVATLFEKAVYRAAGGPELRGAAELESTLRTMVRLYDGVPRTKHVTTNVVVEADAKGDSASARSYFTVLQALADFPLQVIVAGRYADRFVRDGDDWRFAERVVSMDLFGDLSRHLDHFARSR